jgi:hypothetical protein
VPLLKRTRPSWLEKSRSMLGPLPSNLVQAS